MAVVTPALLLVRNDTGIYTVSASLSTGVRHLVEAHGGTVRAYSAGEGQGATFTVDLPLSVSERPTSAPAARTEQVC